MVLLAKGYIVIGLIIISILSSVCAQAPVVLSTTRVPVLGGGVHIYGRNFGSDPSKIKVHIADGAGYIFDCTDVRIVTPDRVIGCQVSTEGTGKSMHVTVILTNGDDDSVANDDSNVAFNRDVPELKAITYSVATKTIVIDGNNFGFETSKVSVVLDGNDYPVLAVKNQAITLRLLKKRREEDYTVPETTYAYVIIDGQANAANLSAALAPAVVTVTGEPVVDYTEEPNARKKSNGGKIAGLVVGGAFALMVVSVFIAVYVMRRTKKPVLEKEEPLPPPSTSSSFSGKPPPLHVYNGEKRRMSLDAASISVLHEMKVAEAQRSPALRSPAFGSPIASPAAGRRSSPATERKSPTPEKKSPPSGLPKLPEEDATVIPLSHTQELEKGIVMTIGDDDDHHSFEEIALHEDIYEQNDAEVSDSSFSESSDDESDDVGGSSSLSAGESDASPFHTPTGGKRKQLQMSSEFPATGSPTLSRSPRIFQSPSPPMLVGSRTAQHPLPFSSLRRSMIPDLALDGDSSDGSPMPTPRTVSPQKGKKKKSSKKGMVRVPSSRLATSGGITKKAQLSVLDSPVL